MSDSLPPTDETACICFWTDPSTWTTHYGAVEPGSQREWNPTCPEHGVMAENAELREELSAARSECAALAAKVEARVEPAKLAAIRERTVTDFVTNPGTVSGPLAKELMQARLDRRALLHALDVELAEHSAPASGMPHTPTQGAREYLCPRCDRWARWTDGETDPVEPTFWCQNCSAETPIRNMDSRLQDGRGDAGASGTGSDRGAGESKLEISTQGIDGESLTGPEIISRTLVLAFGTRHHDRPFIREIAEALDAALRPVHEAAAPDVDGWTLHARPGGLQVSHDTDADMPVLLHDQHLPLGAVLAFIADLDEEAGR